MPKESTRGIKRSAPCRSGFCKCMILSPAIIEVKWCHGRKHIKEQSVGRERRAHLTTISLQKRHERRWKPFIALRISCSMKPRLNRHSVTCKSDSVIRETLCVWIVIHKIVMRTELYSAFSTYTGDFSKYFRIPSRRTDIRQPVIKSPSLPSMFDKHGMRETIFKSLLSSIFGCSVSNTTLLVQINE